jgi:sulfatase maturation enzyme AslB (radical SAM superfamily)
MRYSLHITNKCNLFCTYCYEDDKQEKERKQFVISPAEIDQKMVYILQHRDCSEIELLGGEIFLYPDLIKYVLDKYHSACAFILTTNGTLRNRFIDEMLAKHQPYLGVSLDDPQAVEKQRIGLNLSKVLENAKAWQKYTRVGIAAVLNPLNMRRIKETFDFYVLENGFDSIHFGCVEEYMNDYYWQIYQQEVARFIQGTSVEVLRRVNISPWGYYSVSHKEYVYEDGIEKIERYNLSCMELSAYVQAKYTGYCLYCERVGIQPKPLVPENIKVIDKNFATAQVHWKMPTYNSFTV